MYPIAMADRYQPLRTAFRRGAKKSSGSDRPRVAPKGTGPSHLSPRCSSVAPTTLYCRAASCEGAGFVGLSRHAMMKIKVHSHVHSHSEWRRAAAKNILGYPGWKSD